MNFSESQCVGCSKCCYDTNIPLNKTDLYKLNDSDYYKINTDYFLKTLRYKEHNICKFLDVNEMKCTNYENRPDICKQFTKDRYECKHEIKTTKNMENSGINHPYIKGFTINPNGYCNAKCWFCVNRYKQSVSNNISISNMEIIIDKILKERGNLVKKNLDTIFLHHFNEVLLYPHFEEMLGLLRKKKLKTHIFTNGTNISPSKFDLISQYSDVVMSVILNIPSVEKESWKAHTGLDDINYNKLITNIDYIYKNNIKNIRISIEINGISKQSYLENGGNIVKLSNFPNNIKDDLEIQYELIKNKYPNFTYYFKNSYLSDWGGFLEDNEIYSTDMYNLMKNKKDNTRIVDCNCSHRIFNYLEINSNGDVYLCLDDLELRTKYGNLLEQDLDEIWNSDLRQKVIKKETTDGICTICNLACWE